MDKALVRESAVEAPPITLPSAEGAPLLKESATEIAQAPSPQNPTVGSVTSDWVTSEGVTSEGVTSEGVTSDWWLQLPNILTALRILLIPVMVVAIDFDAVEFALSLFVLAAVTDFVDGRIARRFKAVSDFGKLLDPLADKILVMAALVMLVALRSANYGEPWVPGWMVVMVLAREFWVTGLRGVAASKGLIVAAGAGGKWKSALQMAAVVLLFLHDRTFSFPIIGHLVSCQLIGLNLLLISLILSYWSAVEYSIEIAYLLQRGDPTKR